jgi:hypothetical protein
VKYFYYLSNFWFVPSMFIAGLLLVYAGVNGRESKDDKSNSSANSTGGTLLLSTKMLRGSLFNGLAKSETSSLDSGTKVR